MAIYLPASAEEQDLSLDELTPREIVTELDKHVVGQRAAKRAVAIALRNRQRRQKLPPDIADDIMPKNIIMIGPTGVGKTEIARRLAKLTNSPFLKVEASKFTEVGYVGRDVESMIRDLVEIAIDMVREERLEEVEDRAEMNAEERLLDVLLPPPPPAPHAQEGQLSLPGTESHQRSREKLRQQFREGKLDDRMVELDVRERSTPQFGIISNQNLEDMEMNLKDMLPNIFGGGTKKRKMKVTRRLRLPGAGRRRPADRHGLGESRGGGARGVERHRLSGRDRQDRRARGRPRARRFARRRAARHSAHRGRHHGEHALRHGAHRSHPVYRRRRVSCFQAQRSDSRAAGPLSDSRGAAIAHGGRFSAHSYRAQGVADQAILGAA